jgi:hypothetical protein
LITDHQAKYFAHELTIHHAANDVDRLTQPLFDASDYLQKNSGKPWKYLLIPHDEVKEHNTLTSFAQKFQSSIT